MTPYADVVNWDERSYDAIRMMLNLLRYRDITFPRRFNVDITDFCNRSCSYCPNSVYGSPKNMIDEAVFQRAIECMKEIGWSGQVTYNGYGEPTSVKNLERYVASVKEALPKTISCIYTNGDYMTLDRARSLYESGVNHIIVTRHEPYSDAWNQKLMLIQKWAGRRMTLRSLSKKVIINPAGLVSVPYEPFKRCRLPSNVFAVTVNGDVRLCCADYNKEWIPGNIMKNSVMEIWGSKEFRAVRRRLTFGSKQQLPVCVRCMAGKNEGKQ